MSNIPSSFSKIQIEETAFRTSVGTDLLTRIGASINQGIDNAVPIPLGSVEMSMLTELQFQSVRNAGWVLCDGRDITGSALHTLTGQAIAADSRGRFARGKDHGRGLDPNGNLPIGTQRPDTQLAHAHFPANLVSPDAASSGTSFIVAQSGSDIGGLFPTESSSAISISLSPTGAAESRPTNVTVNFFIRIN